MGKVKSRTLLPCVVILPNTDSTETRSRDALTALNLKVTA
jgi:hypothetical protein